MAAVLDGRRLYANRAELLDVITVTDTERAADLSEVIERASRTRADAARTRPRAATSSTRWPQPQTSPRGGPVTDDDVARLACSLTDPRVRDTLYALAVGRRRRPAEALWALLSRVLPDPWRAEALVLLAFSAYARGDGPLAGVSLEAALRCNADHKMARMLDQALQSGMRPEQIRELARTGYRLAKRSVCGCRRGATSARRAG